MKKIFYLFIPFIIVGAMSCNKHNDNPPAPPVPNLIFKFKFDSTQVRLDNFGNPSTIPAGHAAQSPVFNGMSSHYIEIAPDMYTALGAGKVLYKNDDTNVGGSKAIDFSKSITVGNGETFLSVPIFFPGSGT